TIGLPWFDGHSQVFAIPGGERLGIACFEEYTADSKYLFHANLFPSSRRTTKLTCRGRLQRLHAARNRNAAPVKLSGWLAVDPSRLFAFDDEPVNPCSFGEILHAAMNLRQDALVNHEIRNLDVIDLKRSTQHRRNLEAEALPWPWSQPA